MDGLYERVANAAARGRNEYVNNRLNQLTQIAMTSPPEMQRGIAAEMARLDRNTGVALADQARNRELERLRAQAAFMQQASPDAQQRIYGAMLPGLRSMGLDAPDQFSPEIVAPVRSALFGQQPTQGLTPTFNTIQHLRNTGFFKNDDEYRTAVNIALRSEAGAVAPGYTAEERWNPVTQQKETVFVQTRGYVPGQGMGQPPQARPLAQGAPPNEYQVTVMPGVVQPGEEEAFFNALPPDARRAMREGGTFAGGQQVAPPGVDVVPQRAPTAAPQPAAPRPANGLNALPGAMPAGPSYAEQAAQVREEARQRALGGLEGQGPQERETTLRKEYISEVQSANEVLSQYRKVQNTASDTSAAGDLALIFSFMKMLDPGSVVREQEFANAQNAAGVPDQIRNMWNRVVSGERLNPNQRQDFLNQARNLANDAQTRLTNSQAYYRDLATQYGLSADRVVRPSGDRLSGDVESRIDSYLRGR